MERKADTINVVAHEVAQQRELDRVAHVCELFGGQISSAESIFQVPRDMLLKGNERLFGMWCETFNELDGNPDKLKELITTFTFNNTCNYTRCNICNDIVQEIQNLPRGKETVFRHFILDDAMVCSDLDIAYKFNDITRGSYIRKTNKK